MLCNRFSVQTDLQATAWMLMHEEQGSDRRVTNIRNAEFIEEMIADPVFADMLSTDEGGAHGHSHDHHAGHSHSHPHSHSHSYSHARAEESQSTGTEQGGESSKPTQAENDLAQDKVRSTIRSLVRDWAVEGKPERDACYLPILEALERHFSESETRARSSRRVLVPGCGLGRLAMEIAAKGAFLNYGDC